MKPWYHTALYYWTDNCAYVGADKKVQKYIDVITSGCDKLSNVCQLVFNDIIKFAVVTV